MALTLLLSNRAIQNRAVSAAAAYLSDELGVDAHVGSVSYRPLSVISLQDVYLSDTGRDTLAYIGDLYGDVEIPPLFRGRIVINALTLDRARFRLRAEPDGTTNLQFLIDYFKRPQPVIPDIRIERLRLTRCHAALDFNASPPSPSLDLNHLAFSDLNAVMEGFCTPDSARIRISGLSFSERSGLTVNDLSLEAEMDSAHASVKDARLRMPHSSMRIASLRVEYDSLKGIPLKEMIRKHARLTLDLTSSEWDGRDLAPVWPGCARLTAPAWNACP